MTAYPCGDASLDKMRFTGGVASEFPGEGVWKGDLEFTACQDCLRNQGGLQAGYGGAS